MKPKAGKEDKVGKEALKTREREGFVVATVGIADLGVLIHPGK